jgi:hypothetical protein
MMTQSTRPPLWTITLTWTLFQLLILLNHDGMSVSHVDGFAPSPRIPSHARHSPATPLLLSNRITINKREQSKCKQNLMDLLTSIPPNQSTPQQLTNDLLAAAKHLEQVCPTKEEEVLQELSGNWELIWTAQDKQSEEASSVLSWIK